MNTDPDPGGEFNANRDPKHWKKFELDKQTQIVGTGVHKMLGTRT